MLSPVSYVAAEQLADRQAAAVTFRAARDAAPAPAVTTGPSQRLVLRRAMAQDSATRPIRRLLVMRVAMG